MHLILILFFRWIYIPYYKSSNQYCKILFLFILFLYYMICKYFKTDCCHHICLYYIFNCHLKSYYCSVFMSLIFTSLCIVYSWRIYILVSFLSNAMWIWTGLNIIKDRSNQKWLNSAMGYAYSWFYYLLYGHLCWYDFWI